MICERGTCCCDSLEEAAYRAWACDKGEAEAEAARGARGERGSTRAARRRASMISLLACVQSVQSVESAVCSSVLVLRPYLGKVARGNVTCRRKAVPGVFSLLFFSRFSSLVFSLSFLHTQLNPR